MYEGYPKRGKTGKRPGSGDTVENKRLESRFQKCDFPDSPDEYKRSGETHYRKASLGEAQYDTTTKPSPNSKRKPAGTKVKEYMAGGYFLFP